MDKDIKNNENNLEIDAKDAEFLKQDKIEFEKNYEKKNFYILYGVAILLLAVIMFTLTQLLSSIDEISEILDKTDVVSLEDFTLEDRMQMEIDLQKYLGEWQGNWNNVTTGNQGSIKVIASIDNGKVILDVDVDGMIFGIYNPKQRTIVGDILEDGVYFEVNEDGVFGSVKAHIDYEGIITVNGIKIPLRRVDVVNGTGQIQENNVNIDYTVEWIKEIKTIGKVQLTK